MFDEVGKKLMQLASVLSGLILGGSILVGVVIALLAEGLWGVIFCVIIVICGLIISWLSSVFIYAFGQIVDDIHIIADMSLGEDIEENNITTSD